MTHKFAFLLLTKNEEKTISAVVRGIQNQCARLQISNYFIALSDDSTDATRQISETLGCRYQAGGGQGLGHAYKTGVTFCLKQEFEYLVTLDCDGQTDLNELEFFLKPVVAGTCDLAVASRFLRNSASDIKYEYPRINGIGTKLLSGFLTVMTGQKFTDSHGGIRVMSRQVAESMQVYGSWTYVQESIVDAHEKGFRISELGSTWLKRQHGNSRVVRSIPRYILKVGPFLGLRVLLRVLSWFRV